MLKRILCLLAALLLCTGALAEPRYPDQANVATDSAAVLSIKLLDDLRTLDKRLSKADAPQLYIATVDFLDTSDVQTYANALHTRWELADDAVLLLLCVGEESYAIASGSSARRLLPDAVLNKLLAGQLHEPFHGQRYDAAIAAFAAAYTTEVCKACGVTIKTTDLFRSVSSAPFSNWTSAPNRSNAADDGDSFLTREEQSSGFSLLKVILIVALLLLIFGTFRTVKKVRTPADANPAPEKPEKRPYPVYFKPREKKPTPQYFHPRQPRK